MKKLFLLIMLLFLLGGCYTQLGIYHTRDYRYDPNIYIGVYPYWWGYYPYVHHPYVYYYTPYKYYYKPYKYKTYESKPYKNKTRDKNTQKIRNNSGSRNKR